MILFRTTNPDHARVDKVRDFKESTSYQKGGRWNSRNQPASYFSANLQNAMLEGAAFASSVKGANTQLVIAVYQVDDVVRLTSLDPTQLFAGWTKRRAWRKLQPIGDGILTNAKYDGFIAPSAQLNETLTLTSSNAINQSLYANVILNPTQDVFKSLKLIDTFKPVFNKRMFNR